MRFANILCPVDFSDGSRRALDAAIDVARTNDASLTLAHVVRSPIYDAPETLLSGEVIQAIVDEGSAALTSWVAVATAAGVKQVHAKLITGVAWDEIVRVLDQDRTFDLVVMGTHGRTGLIHAMLGSVAERVVRHAPCTAMIVR